MKQDIPWWLIIAVCILIAGIILTVWSAQQQDQTMRNDLILKASIANSGISTGQVASLSGTAADITSPEYQTLKAQLEKIHASDPAFRFAYLMGQREDGTVILYADSELPESTDYSPPGQVYTEAPAVVRSVFATGNRANEGPYTDRWGTWVSGFIPVTDPATGRVIAIFGMDLNAQNWNTTIFKASLPTLISSLLIVLLVLVSALFQRRSDEEKLRLKISEEKFSKVFHANPALMAVSTLKEGRFLDVNSSFLATFGYPRNEVIGKTTSDLHLFFDTAQEDSIIRQIQETGQVRNQEVRFFRKNQDLLDGSLTSITVDIAGIPRLLTIILDLTERKRAEAALQRQATILAILNNVITTANRAQNLDEVTEKIVEDIMRLLDYDAGGIYLVDPGSTTATIIHSKNIPLAFLEEVKTVSIVKPPYNILFTEGTPIISSHYDELYPDRSKLSGFLSFATIPIISQGKIIGSLNVASRKRDEISGQERQVLLTIGQELGSTIERLTALRYSENAAHNLLTLFNSINDMVFVLDMQGRIKTVNNAVKKTLLYTEEELAGTDVLLIHVPERRDEALKNVQGMIAGTIDSCPVPILAKDGTRIEVDTKVSRGTWNNIEVIVGVSRDITERKKAEEALKKSEELLNLAITGSGAGLWDWNVQTGEMVFNERWAEIIGYSLDELQPLSIATWTILVHPDDLTVSNELLRKHFEGDLQDYEIEARMKHKDGHWVWVHDRGMVTQWDNDGKPLRMTGTRLDISRRKALEMEIEFHEQELMQHSAMLSREITERRRIEDEIRTINQELEIRVRDRTKELAETVRKLQDENTERKRVEELIRLANRKLALMNEVSYQDIQNKITALRGFVSIIQKANNEEVRQEYYKKEENILKSIHNLIKNTRDFQKLGVDKYQWIDMEMVVSRIKLPQGSEVSLTSDLHGLSIYSDPQVSKVFDLLVDNAVKHGKKITRISISCSVSMEDITIVFEDDGVGIPSGEKARIFERVVSGEGKFGLFFVHELLILSSMTITENGEPGKGARFEITVPKGAWRMKGNGA